MKNLYPRAVQRGYVAIVSALILSTILTALVLVESTGIFWSRLDQLDQLHQINSIANTESCTYLALRQYAEEPDAYAYNSTQTLFKKEEVMLTENSTIDCFIDSIVLQRGEVHIATHSISTHAVSSISLLASILSSGVLKVTTWRNSTSIPP